MKFLAVVLGAFLVNEALGCATCGVATHIPDYDSKPPQTVKREDRGRPKKGDDDYGCKPKVQVKDCKPTIRLVDYDVKWKQDGCGKENKYVIISDGGDRHCDDDKQGCKKRHYDDDDDDEKDQSHKQPQRGQGLRRDEWKPKGKPVEESDCGCDQ